MIEGHLNAFHLGSLDRIGIQASQHIAPFDQVAQVDQKLGHDGNLGRPDELKDAVVGLYPAQARDPAGGCIQRHSHQNHGQKERTGSKRRHASPCGIFPAFVVRYVSG